MNSLEALERAGYVVDEAGEWKETTRHADEPRPKSKYRLEGGAKEWGKPKQQPWERKRYENPPRLPERPKARLVGGKIKQPAVHEEKRVAPRGLDTKRIARDIKRTRAAKALEEMERSRNSAAEAWRKREGLRGGKEIVGRAPANPKEMRAVGEKRQVQRLRNDPLAKEAKHKHFKAPTSTVALTEESAKRYVFGDMPKRKTMRVSKADDQKIAPGVFRRTEKRERQEPVEVKEESRSKVPFHRQASREAFPGRARRGGGSKESARPGLSPKEKEWFKERQAVAPGIFRRRTEKKSMHETLKALEELELALRESPGEIGPRVGATVKNPPRMGESAPSPGVGRAGVRRVPSDLRGTPIKSVDKSGPIVDVRSGPGAGKKAPPPGPMPKTPQVPGKGGPVVDTRGKPPMPKKPPSGSPPRLAIVSPLRKTEEGMFCSICKTVHEDGKGCMASKAESGNEAMVRRYMERIKKESKEESAQRRRKEEGEERARNPRPKPGSFGSGHIGPYEKAVPRLLTEMGAKAMEFSGERESSRKRHMSENQRDFEDKRTQRRVRASKPGATTHEKIEAVRRGEKRNKPDKTPRPWLERVAAEKSLEFMADLATKGIFLSGHDETMTSKALRARSQAFPGKVVRGMYDPNATWRSATSIVRGLPAEVISTPPAVSAGAAMIYKSCGRCGRSYLSKCIACGVGDVVEKSDCAACSDGDHESCKRGDCDCDTCAKKAMEDEGKAVTSGRNVDVGHSRGMSRYDDRGRLTFDSPRDFERRQDGSVHGERQRGGPSFGYGFGPGRTPRQSAMAGYTGKHPRAAKSEEVASGEVGKARDELERALRLVSHPRGGEAYAKVWKPGKRDLYHRWLDIPTARDRPTKPKYEDWIEPKQPAARKKLAEAVAQRRSIKQAMQILAQRGQQHLYDEALLQSKKRIVAERAQRKKEEKASIAASNRAKKERSKRYREEERQEDAKQSRPATHTEQRVQPKGPSLGLGHGHSQPSRRTGNSPTSLPPSSLDYIKPPPGTSSAGPGAVFRRRK